MKTGFWERFLRLSFFIFQKVKGENTVTKLDILYKLEDVSNEMCSLLSDSEIDRRKLTKLKKSELCQFVETFETMNKLLSKCVVKKKESSRNNHAPIW